MESPAVASLPRAPSGADVLAVGFATTVAMWAVGYFGRLPSVTAPSALLLVLFLVCLAGGGFFAGRLTGRGTVGGVWVGLLSGLANLLVLGSLISGDRPNRIDPSALVWLPGFVVASAALGGMGAALGARASRPRVEPDRWPGAFALVAALATLLLLAVGGLVTSKDAGLAVVDWPNSYGYNMFLFPLSRMTGGIYYEHAHRLFGALVGLTTLCLAVVLQRVDERPRVRLLGWVALGMVVVQGVLGGIRVTGGFTLSTSPEDMAPSVVLAAVHGVLGQVFLGTMVALAVVTSRGWRRSGAPVVRATSDTDRTLGWLLIVLLVFQLVLGALQRHLASGLLIHVTTAVIVAVLALAVGARAWQMNPGEPLLMRLGKGLLGLTGLQLLLGTGALVATGAMSEDRFDLSTFGVTVTTAHQWCGALLLALSVTLLLWTYRRLAPEG